MRKKTWRCPHQGQAPTPQRPIRGLLDACLQKDYRTHVIGPEFGRSKLGRSKLGEFNADLFPHDAFHLPAPFAD
jgi:hypothetical protein